MLPAERKQQILAILKQHREVSVQALAEALEEPAANVRRDLRELEKENRIVRRHGRALYRASVVPTPLEPEGDLDPAVLDDLVEETARMLQEPRNLFLSGGPVLVRVAQRLEGKTVATNDLAVAMGAAQGDNDVTLVGREVDNRTLTLRSPSFERELQPYRFDVAVIETDGIDEHNLWVARTVHVLLEPLLERADSLFCIARSAALGRKGDRVAGPLGRADVVLIDRGASEEALRLLAAANVEFRVAGAGEESPYAHDAVGNLFQFKRGQGFAAAPAPREPRRGSGPAPAPRPGRELHPDDEDPGPEPGS